MTTLRTSVGILLALTLVANTHNAKADLTIVPTFDSNITTDPNAATIEAGINAAITRVEADISNPITVTIEFQEASSGLGESSTTEYGLSYSGYRSALVTNASSPQDTLALASLPTGSTNPVDANASIDVTSALARGLGFNTPGAVDGTFDSQISLNTSIMNLSRTGAQNSSFYDLQAVAAHEMDETLGISGPGSVLPTTTGAVGVLDLFRYSAAGTRSFTTSTSAAPYFSIDGGVTDLVHFNQVNGGDYADWGNGVIPAQGAGNSPAQVQDAFSSPDVDVNIGSTELTALDVVGYHLTSAGTSLETVPEPGMVYLLPFGLVALGFFHRFRKVA